MQLYRGYLKYQLTQIWNILQTAWLSILANSSQTSKLHIVITSICFKLSQNCNLWIHCKFFTSFHDKRKYKASAKNESVHIPWEETTKAPMDMKKSWPKKKAIAMSASQLLSWNGCENFAMRLLFTVVIALVSDFQTVIFSNSVHASTTWWRWQMMACLNLLLFTSMLDPALEKTIKVKSVLFWLNGPLVPAQGQFERSLRKMRQVCCDLNWSQYTAIICSEKVVYQTWILSSVHIKLFYQYDDDLHKKHCLLITTWKHN